MDQLYLRGVGAALAPPPVRPEQLEQPKHEPDYLVVGQLLHTEAEKSELEVRISQLRETLLQTMNSHDSYDKSGRARDSTLDRMRRLQSNVRKRWSVSTRLRLIGGFKMRSYIQNCSSIA